MSDTDKKGDTSQAEGKAWWLEEESSFALRDETPPARAAQPPPAPAPGVTSPGPRLPAELLVEQERRPVPAVAPRAAVQPQAAPVVPPPKATAVPPAPPLPPSPPAPPPHMQPSLPARPFCPEDGAKQRAVFAKGGGSLWQMKAQTYSSYLRFYADGTVIGVSTTGTPAQIARWFKAPYSNSGHYSISGSSLKFSLTSPQGTVDYDGVICGSSLQVNVFSHINGRRGTDYYELVPE